MLSLHKTVRKYFGEAITVTQEVDDIISSSIVKDSIINNADCKILLDQRKYMTKFDGIQSLLGLSDKEKASVPIVAMTANAFAEDRQKAFNVGMNGHIAKPINTEILRETLRELL